MPKDNTKVKLNLSEKPILLDILFIFYLKCMKSDSSTECIRRVNVCMVVIFDLMIIDYKA